MLAWVSAGNKQHSQKRVIKETKELFTKVWAGLGETSGRCQKGQERRGIAP